MHATFEELPLNDLDKAWCAGLLGGSVNGPYKPKKNHPGQGEMITWGLYRKENALKVIKTLYPLLGKRRQEQCQKVWKNLTGVDYAQ